MSNIFSSRTYTLPCGMVIPLPRGISVGQSKNRYVYASVRIDGKLHRYESLALNAKATILRAVVHLQTAIEGGALPGGYHANKRKDQSTSDLPPGLTVRFLPSTQEYRLYISYPDVASEKLKHVNHYVGNENTYSNNYDSVAKRAIDFRNDALASYAAEFLNRLSLLKEQLENENNENKIAA